MPTTDAPDTLNLSEPDLVDVKTIPTLMLANIAHKQYSSTADWEISTNAPAELKARYPLYRTGLQFCAIMFELLPAAWIPPLCTFEFSIEMNIE
ncbi:hypothetical protein E4U32_006285 [Claviceps aff. humidiphila group G2b]|nr:hypothetical protein E4U32_006285 [Claviceps aff. humidiphila group G2b]